MNDDGWVTHPQAAELLGVGTTSVQRMLDDGRLDRRPARHAVVSLASVLRMREQLVLATEQRRLRAERKAEAAASSHPEPTPPDDEHTWLRTKQAAAMLGITGPGLIGKAKRGTVPCVEADGVRWFRQDHLDLVARARTAKTARTID